MLLYVITVYASLLGPVSAIGGIIAGLLWGLRQYNVAVVAVVLSGVVLGFLSSQYNAYAEWSDHIYFVSAHLCALILWALFAAVFGRMIPGNLPGQRRSWLQSRVKLGP